MSLPLSDGASRFPAALGLALGGGAAPPGAAVQASALVALRGHLWLSPELALREGVAASPGGQLRYRTTIDLGLRVFLARRAWTPSVRVAFSHVHQEGHQDFIEHPLGSAFGVAESIDHRTGLALGLGLELPRPVGPRGRRSRVRGFAHLDAQATWTPGSAAPQASVVFSAGTWLGLGRRPPSAGVVRR